MASVGFGRTSSINRIPTYRTSSRTYKGVKTSKMVSGMTTSLQKAQDAQMKNMYETGQVSVDKYASYLQDRANQVSDQTYKTQLTSEAQSIQTNAAEQNVLNAYNSGQASAGQVAAFYQNLLSTINPDNPLYNKTQANVAKYNKLGVSDSYKTQEAVLKEQYTAAEDRLPAAQKLLDFNMQYLQKLSPNDPAYTATLGNIGTYQKEVQTLQAQQARLKAEDYINKTYNKGTAEDYAAKSQMYAQLRDSAAQSGDTTDYYKYDSLANTAQQQVQVAQTKEVATQVHSAISQVKSDYLSGKIDGATAQSQLQQISDAADQAGDTTGVILAHDMYNTVQGNIDHGVSYGGDNGFGKVKGGTGGGDSANAVYDGSTGQIVGGYTSSGSAHSGGSSTTVGAVATHPSSNVNTPQAKTASSTPISSVLSGKNGQQLAISMVQQAMADAHYTNPPAQVLQQVENGISHGATQADVTLFFRTQKVGTGDGLQALKDAQVQTAKTAEDNLRNGFDSNGQPYSLDNYKQDMQHMTSGQIQQYTLWQNYIQANPNQKINVNGVNKKLSELAPTINETINGKTTFDPKRGVNVVKQQGLISQLQQYSDKGYQPFFVQDPNNLSQFIPQDVAQKANLNGDLSPQAGKYLNVGGVYYRVNGGKALPVTDQYGNTNYIPNPAGKSVVVYGPDGKYIQYHLDQNNQITGVNNSDNNLPKGWLPTTLHPFGIATKGAADWANQQKQIAANTAQQSRTAMNLKIPGVQSVNDMLSGKPAMTFSSNPLTIPSQPQSTAPAQPGKVVSPQQPFANPIDQLISTIVNPRPFTPPAVTLTQPIPLNNQGQPQQQSFQQSNNNQAAVQTTNPTKLYNAGIPTTSFAGKGISGGNNLNMGSLPKVSPLPQQPNWLTNAGGQIGHAIDTGISSAGKFLGGLGSSIGNMFHF